MSFLRELLASKPVRTPLDFGINDNVRITSITNEERKRDGELVPRNCFVTYTKFNSNNESIAESEFSYFNLNPTAERLMENISTQLGHLQNIVNILNPGVILDPTSDYEDIDELNKNLKKESGCLKLQNKMWSLFSEAVADKIGLESPLLRIKVVTDNKGKYLQLPKETMFLEPMTLENSNLSLSAYDLKCRDKGLEPTTAKPDASTNKNKATSLSNL